jgi:lysophospholipase L1-like esterase
MAPSADTPGRLPRCFVAVGDSLSASADGGSWADRVATTLRPIRYVNLAVGGATTRDVELRQLGHALTFDPDLVSIVCGSNDMLQSLRPDVAGVAVALARMCARVKEAVPAARLVTATYPDPTRFVRVRQRTALRLRASNADLNQAIRAVAAEADALCLDWAEHPAVFRRDNFADDGFHPAPELHRQAAAFAVHHILEFLAIEAGEEAA